MPSSTSSSSAAGRVPAGPWGRTWVLSLLLTVAVLGGAEAFWRSRGFRPSVTDTSGLWAYNRMTLDVARNRAVALVGASRIHVGIDTDVFRERFPKHRVVQLALRGKWFNATLQDLSQDSRFVGTVICSVTSGNLQNGGRSNQQVEVDFYRAWAFPSAAESIMRGGLQANLVAATSQVRLLDVADELAWEHALPSPKGSYLRMRLDRSIRADYRLLDIAAFRARRVQGRKDELADFVRPSPPEWLRKTHIVEGFVRNIQARGGRVVLVRFPTTGAHWSMDQWAFPKVDYWDRFAAQTEAVTIHFRDVPILRDFECPDTSHIDYRDAPRFTNALLDELVRRGVLPGDEM